MMFIFEGVDHVGKDTTIEIFKKIWHKLYGNNIPSFDGFNVYDKNLTEQLKDNINEPKEWQKAIGYEVVNFCKQTKIDVIVNRFNWSEIVYGYVLRDGTDMDWYWTVMERELLGNAVIIYLTADTEDILERIKNSDRQKSEKVVEAIDTLKKGYEILLKHTKLPGIVINTSNGFDEIANDVYQIIKKSEEL